MAQNQSNSMKCVEISEPGEPSVLKIASRPIPQVTTNTVLVKVLAAGINYPDVLQRKGLYNPPPGASDLPGLEVAGEIAEVGEGVTAFKVGDMVCALAPGGGYAEYCLIPEEQCLPSPKGLSPVEAAALPETFFTVWFNLFVLGNLHKGQSLLIHGGTSGIGTTAIQIAKNLGVKVFTTAGTDKKCNACRSLGADVAINYRSQDFVQIIADETSGKGVDVVLDMVGGDYMQKNIDSLAQQGRLISLWFLGGSKAEVDFKPVLIKNLTLTGSTLRPQPISVKKKIASDLQERIWPLLENKNIKPVVYKVFPMREADKAHTLMESSQHIGKIVLSMSE
ncbi:MAG: NAD(P)H-quinone oxidoreductase [Sneathiella sp.]